MRCVILAGGLGTRLSEETALRPKPMVEIGGKPMLWHILKGYSAHGVNDFAICLGYRGYMIKEYFANYALHMSDITVDMATGQTHVHKTTVEPWRVTLADTGDNAQTGGRLRAIRDHLGDDDFCFTYGDGVSDVDVSALIAFHKSHGRLATVTAVKPQGRYGTLDLADSKVRKFVEKPPGDGAWINGGFFVLSPKVIDYIDDESTSFEGHVMAKLASDDQLRAYKHEGYWKAVDTLRDRNELESEWQSGCARWKTW